MQSGKAKWIGVTAALFVSLFSFTACTSQDTHHATATDTTTATTPVRDTTVIKKDTTITTDTLKQTKHAKKK